MTTKNLKKNEIIEILVETYGYDKEDLKTGNDGKPYTNAQLLQMIESEEADAKRIEYESQKTVSKRNKIKSDEEITIMSGISSVEYYSQKNNRKWSFNDFGQIDTMDYAELISMHNRYPSYINEGYIIVLDKLVQEELNLVGKYESLITPSNIDEILNLEADALEEFIDNMPEGQKQLLVSKAVEYYEANKLDKVSVVKMFENKFNFDFKDNSPLNDIVAVAQNRENNVIYVDKR